jgi:hypothetical protein
LENGSQCRSYRPISQQRDKTVLGVFIAERGHFSTGQFPVRLVIRDAAKKRHGTSFAQYERAFREQLGDMFAPGGFDPRRDIAGIILNRWGHAYVNPQPGFFFGVNGKPAPRDVLRGRPHGRIAFANTDLAGASDHRNSIREADRAVKQLVGA